MTKIVLAIVSIVTFSFSSVDINHANVKELSSLDGIGQAKAMLIKKYIKKNGCFKDIKSLTKVKGIGEAILNKNKKNIKITSCKK